MRASTTTISKSRALELLAVTLPRLRVGTRSLSVCVPLDLVVT
jgi:hypothetical protein